MFITFIQNNSGGYFIKDENVDVFVIIEGDSLKEILDKASDVFEDYREFCPCCGERWDDDYKSENNLEEEPMIYGESVYEFNDSWYKNSRAIIYRADGTKEIVDICK